MADKAEIITVLVKLMALKELLKVASGGVVFTTIQKFQPDEGNVYEELSDRKNIVVIADEAHRTQYGFQAKTIDHKDSEGNVIVVGRSRGVVVPNSEENKTISYRRK